MRKSVINSDRFTGSKIINVNNLVYLVIFNYGSSPVKVTYNDYDYLIPAADTSKGVDVPQNPFKLDCKNYPFDVKGLKVEAGTNTVIMNMATLSDDC